MNKILTEKELAGELGLSIWTVRGMRIKEGCPHFNVGYRIFYRLESVLAWMDSRELGQQKLKPEYGKLRRID